MWSNNTCYKVATECDDILFSNFIADLDDSLLLHNSMAGVNISLLPTQAVVTLFALTHIW